MDKKRLEEMLMTMSVSGHEEELQRKVIGWMKEEADQCLTDATGNVISVLNPDSPVKILLCGHIDEIGLIVTKIQSDGFLRVTAAGGVRAPLYLGTHVQINTKKGLIPGVVVTSSVLLKKTDLDCSDLVIDIGASNREEAMQVVSVGDSVCAATDFKYLLNDKMAARAMDNRIGAFIVLEVLKKAKEKGCTNGVYAATTVGEETTMRGAKWATQKVKPTCAVAVDVTYTYDYEGMNSSSLGEAALSKGPVLCHSSIVSKKMNDLLVECANRLGIELQWEICSGRTHTDADQIHFSNDGVPVALVSIPLRYMHSSIETLSLSDVENIIDLLAELVCEYTEKINLNPFDE